MSQTSPPIGSTYFEQVPVSAIVLNGMLADRLTGGPLAVRAKKILSHSLTLALLAISCFGFYEIASIVSPAHSHTPASSVAASAVAPTAALRPTVRATPSLARSVPTSLSISSIGVNAPVVGVGQNSDGSIEVPGPDDVGWYKLGPTPGEIGPAVLVGHVDNATTGPAIFWNLRDMKPGDLVQVARGDGKTVTFKVEAVESYGQDNFPTQSVYGNIDYPGLRLITCTGDFNYLTHHYSDNLVVYARAQL
jgi:hypothetical protein